MDETQELVAIILFMALVTCLPRILPLYIDTKKLPQWFHLSLEFVPVAIVAAITVPNILLNGMNNYFVNAEFIASIIAFLVAIYSKNLPFTIFISLIVFLGIDYGF